MTEAALELTEAAPVKLQGSALIVDTAAERQNLQRHAGGDVGMLKILLVLACPKHTCHLRLHAEERAIRQAIARGKHRNSISLDVLPAATVDDLSRALMEQDYTLIHFSGHSDPVITILSLLLAKFREHHGEAALLALKRDETAVAALEAAAAGLHEELEAALTEELRGARRNSKLLEVNLELELAEATEEDDPAADASAVTAYSLVARFSASDLLDAGVGSLAFESETGHCCFVRPHEFAELLSAHSPPLKCAVLNACGSSLQGLLTSRTLPVSIGMGGRITDAEAALFSGGFYDALAAGRGIGDAYAEGVRRMGLHALDHSHPLRITHAMVSPAAVPANLHVVQRSPPAAVAAAAAPAAAVVPLPAAVTTVAVAAAPLAVAVPLQAPRVTLFTGGPLAAAEESRRRAAGVDAADEDSFAWARNPLLGPLTGLHPLALMPAALDATATAAAPAEAAAAAAVSSVGDSELTRQIEYLHNMMSYGKQLLKEKDEAIERRDEVIRRLEEQLSAVTGQRRRSASMASWPAAGHLAALEAAPGWEGSSSAKSVRGGTNKAASDGSGRASPIGSSGNSNGAACGKKKQRRVVVKQTKSSMLLKALGKRTATAVPQTPVTAASPLVDSSSAASGSGGKGSSGGNKGASQLTPRLAALATEALRAQPQASQKEMAQHRASSPAGSPPREQQQQQQQEQQQTLASDGARPLLRLAAVFGGAAHGMPSPGATAAVAAGSAPTGGTAPRPSPMMAAAAGPPGSYQFCSRTPRFQQERLMWPPGHSLRRPLVGNAPLPPPPPPPPLPPFGGVQSFRVAGPPRRSDGVGPTAAGSAAVRGLRLGGPSVAPGKREAARGRQEVKAAAA